MAAWQLIASSELELRACIFWQKLTNWRANALLTRETWSHRWKTTLHSFSQINGLVILVSLQAPIECISLQKGRFIILGSGPNLT